MLRVSEQQFSSQPVLLARSYESVHLKLGSLTFPSLHSKSHLLPLFPFIFWPSSQRKADVIYWRRGLLIVKPVSLERSSRNVYLKTKRKKKKYESGTSRGIMNETEQIPPHIQLETINGSREDETQKRTRCRPPGDSETDYQREEEKKWADGGKRQWDLKKL